MADIFISYTRSDREWAFWIAKRLEALGHTPHVHEWEIGAGDDIYAWMERRHAAAEHVLCVVSDDYMNAPYSTLERNAALWRAAAERPGFVLFVVVKATKLPSLSDHIRRCELVGLPEEAAQTRFDAFLRAPAAPDQISFPGKVVALTNIPIRVPTHFLGRDDALAAIEAGLKRFGERVAITALHGLRGVGKTTLAAAFAEMHRNDYRATWWIRAQTPETMRADLAGLGVRLKWVAADEKEEPELGLVMERLRQEGEGLLLIYDNAIDAKTLKNFLPRGGAASVLVTSNAPGWRGVAEPVEIRLWPREIGADYLVARTGRESERAAAESLSQALGGLPLAHEQAAAYCERLEISLAEYAKRFAAAPARLLDAGKDAPEEYHDGLTVAKTFQLAIEEAGKLHAKAEPLLIHCALLAPEPIPLFLLAELWSRPPFSQEVGEGVMRSMTDEGALSPNQPGNESTNPDTPPNTESSVARREPSPDPTSSGHPLPQSGRGDAPTPEIAEDLEEALATLRAFALVDREAVPDERDPQIETECIRLHRLVREVAAGRCLEVAREATLRTLIEATATVLPAGWIVIPNERPRARRLEAIAFGLNWPDKLPSHEEDSVGALLHLVVTYRHGQLPAFAAAPIPLERVSATSEKAGEVKHPDITEAVNNIGVSLMDAGDFANARLLFERAVSMSEEAYQRPSLDIAEPQQSGQCAPGRWRLSGCALAFSARAGDLRKYTGPRTSHDGDRRQQPCVAT